jgi:hypothetical protein
MLMKRKAATGYLNDWDIADKETNKPPTGKGKGMDRKYINEE